MTEPAWTGHPESRELPCWGGGVQGLIRGYPLSQSQPRLPTPSLPQSSNPETWPQAGLLTTVYRESPHCVTHHREPERETSRRLRPVSQL